MPRKSTIRVPTILYVENGRFVSRTYTQGLEEAGFHVITASDGVEAVEKMRTEPPDIVLLELLLPKKSGFEVIEDMRIDSLLQHIPVVILTNLDHDSDREKAKELNVSDYLVKPSVTIDSVIESVKRALGSRENNREL